LTASYSVLNLTNETLTIRIKLDQYKIVDEHISNLVYSFHVKIDIVT